ncbi:SoxR reducing system RseC family protein [Vreelandella titanicae]|uniref:Positive regulator of sigma(E), RseC/MucC n=1 Tax=Vreelandella titanicae BH1 TaxID=1204738 RepID=L9UD29_9GAMM|nr:SoxR reducing system RseC family protein [Halomonas titanicae]ELY22128.1 Positive regulator of sigma(E), RseC/MucC [Halomonas titanicae BH1]NVE89562.1 SoxR reducing system RseC family protein [Halomonas titanicae]|tara:strand:- start:698 stop:1165 length:468 start_codon:yes stop_codon:yes gene_type:complete
MTTSAPCGSLLGTSLLRTGTVVDYTSQGVIIEIAAQQNCEQCAQGRGCGVGLLARQRSQRIAVAVPSKTDNAERNYPLGSQVTISLPRASVTLLAFCVYGLPLLLALLLSGLIALVSTTIWLVPLSFFIALMAGALSIKCLMRGRGERFRPRLVN